jgi:hypothetical protein
MNRERLRGLTKAGRMPIYERRLEELVWRGVRAEDAEAKRKHPLVVLNKSTVPAGGGDYISVLIRDALEEAGQGQGDASSEDASFLVVANPPWLRRGARPATPCSPRGSWLGLTRGKPWIPLRTGLDIWLRDHILWSSTSFLKTRYDRGYAAFSRKGKRYGALLS